MLSVGAVLGQDKRIVLCFQFIGQYRQRCELTLLFALVDAVLQEGSVGNDGIQLAGIKVAYQGVQIRAGLMEDALSSECKRV